MRTPTLTETIDRRTENSRLLFGKGIDRAAMFKVSDCGLVIFSVMTFRDGKLNSSQCYSHFRGVFLLCF